MNDRHATAIAHPNIAFIKYWGNKNPDLRLPANGSISMTLSGLQSKTSVSFRSDLDQDQFVFEGEIAPEQAAARVSNHLNRIRLMAGLPDHARVESQNNFPQGAGIASSASGFAALTVAAASAAGLELDSTALSRIARQASGSASRSIFGGYVEWHAGTSDQDSYAEQLAEPDHWALVDWIVIVEEGEKSVGSNEGHQLADGSPLQTSRVESAPQRLANMRQAILSRNFATVARVAELDSDMMHAVMMTSTPPLLYWRGPTVEVMHRVRSLRQQGVPVFYTIDAGANPHCICPEDRAEIVQEALLKVPGVRRLIRAQPGGPARLAQPE